MVQPDLAEINKDKKRKMKISMIMNEINDRISRLLSRDEADQEGDNLLIIY
jgi:hypothetical protein